MPGPFGRSAEQLWAAGLSAIPLLPRQKRTVVRGWSAFSNMLPDAQTRAAWMMFEGQDESNVGVVMGPASGVVALDVDTDDPVIEGVLRKILPLSPWERVGKKGRVWLYKWTPATRTFRVDLAEGGRGFELLAAGTQIVVPPSIHPDTQREYVSNCDLAELMATRRGEVKELPADVEAMIRDGLTQAGVKLKPKSGEGGKGGIGRVTEWVPVGGRDTRMVAMAGAFARDVTRGERTLLEALAQMQAWVDSFVEKVWGDQIDPEKAARKVVEFVLRDVTGPRKLTLPEGWDAGLDEETKERLGLGIIDDSARRWSSNEIQEYISVELSRPEVAGNEVALTRIAENAAARIASNPDLGALEESRLLRFLANATQSKTPDLRKLISGLRRGEIEGTDHHEIAMAALTDLEAFGEIRHWSGKFWQWKGSHWESFEDQKVISHLSEHYSKYPAMKKRGDHLGALAVMRDSERVRKPLMVAGLNGINFVNGFLTEDGELKAHNPDFGMTYVLPYAYRPELSGTAPRWFAMLQAFWGDDDDYADKIRLLQEAFAVTLFGVAARYQKAFVLYGVAHAGKSQIRYVLENLMPKGCVSTVAPGDWSNPFLPAEMAGKLLNVAGEISEHVMIDGEKFKQIVEGAPIMAQKKHQQPFTFNPMCAQWFLGNFLPRSRDSSEGFTRRFAFLKFNKAFPAQAGVKVNDYFEVVVAEEREAIAAWAVEGMRALRDQGHIFTEPQSHKECANEVAERNNNVRSFISGLQQQGRIRLGQQAHKGQSVTSTQASDLYNVYRSFCFASGGVSPVGLGAFISRLEEVQGRYGFEFKKVTTAPGVTVPICFWLTLVEKRAA
jgi:P4 family phage/plasmid primase-like protien